MCQNLRDLLSLQLPSLRGAFLRGLSSLRGAQRRGNPYHHGLPRRCAPRNDGSRNDGIVTALFGLTQLFLLALGLSYSVQAIALPTDTEQTIHISADSSMFDYKSGINSYQGNVKVDQGTSHLTADRVTTKNNEQHRIEEAIAYGDKQLAEYTTIPKPNDKPFQAKAKIIKFYPLKSLISLEGDVVVTQGENSFNGPIIIYNIKDQTVSAPASKVGRTTIVIEPKQFK